MTALLIVGVVALCAASAVLGRLVLTREEARRTITVRVPAIALLIIATSVLMLFSALFGVGCFICGSFYGLCVWWWPSLGSLFENTQYILNAMLSGEWDGRQSDDPST